MQGDVGTSDGLRFLAFYLPQFHPVPENDEWWGSGFTEWDNVRSARPLFDGHYQPHVPAELGYYDLRNNDVRQRQAELASAFGIDGFVYYHYWFSGRRLLSSPLDSLLAGKSPDFPFCLCWANENWTRAWDGRENDVLLRQSYSLDDHRSHARWLAEVMKDPRYIRVEGRPLWLVYRASRIPDVAAAARIWRREISSSGAGDPYLCRVENFPDERGDPEAIGFDACVEFQPDWLSPGPVLSADTRQGAEPVECFDYRAAVALALDRPRPNYKRYPCVTPGFDNTARRRRHPVVFDGSSPAVYARFVQGVTARFEPYSMDENLVFVNAWNEWGEGCHLEPDVRWGRRYLEANRVGRMMGRQSHPEKSW